VGPGPVPLPARQPPPTRLRPRRLRHPGPRQTSTAWPRPRMPPAPSTTPSTTFLRTSRPTPSSAGAQDGALGCLRMKARDAARLGGLPGGDRRWVPAVLCFHRRHCGPRPDAAAPKDDAVTCTTCWKPRCSARPGWSSPSPASSSTTPTPAQAAGQGAEQLKQDCELKAFERLAPNLEQPWQMEKSSGWIDSEQFQLAAIRNQPNSYFSNRQGIFPLNSGTCSAGLIRCGVPGSRCP